MHVTPAPSLTMMVAQRPCHRCLKIHPRDYRLSFSGLASSFFKIFGSEILLLPPLLSDVKFPRVLLSNRLCFSTTLQSQSTALTSKKSEFLTDSSRCSLSESPSYFPFLASRALTVPRRLLARICWFFPFQPHSAPLLSGRMFKLFPRQICLRHLLTIICFLFSPPLCQCFLLHPTESLLQSLLLGLLPLSFLGAALPLSSPRNRFLSPCDRCHWAPPGRAPRQLA